MIQKLVEKNKRIIYTIGMKHVFYTLFTLTFIICSIGFGKDNEKRDMLYGQRYGIQVASEVNPPAAYKKYPTYRPYAKPFLYQTKISICDEQNKNCRLEKRYRIIIGLYKTKKEADLKLKDFKSKNKEAFKEAFVQLVVE